MDPSEWQNVTEEKKVDMRFFRVEVVLPYLINQALLETLEQAG